MVKVRVVVLDDDRVQSTHVAQALVENDYDVVARFPIQPGQGVKLNKLQYDAVVIDCENANSKLVELVSEILRLRSSPMVVFAEQCSPQLTEEMIQVGVAALVINGFHERRITSVMNVATARHRYYRRLKQQIDQARHSLMERKLIDRAKGLIMQHRHLNEDDAYRSMRKLAMDRNQKLVDVAKSIIEVSELLI